MKKNDVTKNVKSKVVLSNSGVKKVTVKLEEKSSKGYDGCGTHSHS